MERLMIDPTRGAMKKLVTVNLMMDSGVFVVVEAKTGVYYTNQVGGTSCSHPGAEGFLIPMRNFDPEDELSKLTLDFWPYIPDFGNIEEKLAFAISQFEVIDTRPGVDNVSTWSPELDSARIYGGIKYGEAWIPVTTPYGPGWLTWENSD